MTQFNRRKFIQTTAVLGTAGILSPNLIASDAILSEDDPIAKALGYFADAKAVDTTKYPKRAGSAGATQFCNNCALYSDEVDGFGKCSAIPGKRVAGAGWCNVWAPQS
ncbi:MAG: high-potential iron-sulfur protein [Pseudomonadota bacterium]